MTGRFDRLHIDIYCTSCGLAFVVGMRDMYPSLIGFHFISGYAVAWDRR